HVAGRLAAPGGMADQHCVVQIKCFDERRQIVSVVVHVVAVPGLAGSSTAATVMGDGAIALGGHEEGLVVPGIGSERPAMAEDDGMARAPVLVKNRRAVPGGNGTRTHGVKSSFQDQPLCHSFREENNVHMNAKNVTFFQFLPLS